MRTLVIGAGAVGGYFGGRLLQAQRDVTFLVRPGRARELANSGLQIRSASGNAVIAAPPTIFAKDLADPFDLVLLSCKAYDLESAISSMAPAVGPNTAILPLLNGMRHLNILDASFGPSRVLGGRCLIAATLNKQRQIVHLNNNHALTFGERDGSMSDRVIAIGALMNGALFDHQASPHILLEMWEKWTFLATLAGSTCLFRGAVGDICAAPGGSEFVMRLFEECRSIAEVEGFPPSPAFLERSRSILTEAGSPLTASMLRDIEAGAPIEADHIIGDLLNRVEKPMLRIAFSALKTYEARRSRML
uniref:2-dehydropantoate 2-reductase n=1 Tax=Solibacter usitatus (strain Ellin6076) TaxID=234267 RepID=Q02B99_SOLUE